MKYLVLIGDGMADFPLEELGGKTPLMVAKKRYMDMMAQRGISGRVITVPEGFPPGSDIACMSLFGYDPRIYYTGRAPIEFYGMGYDMEKDDVAFRCNLVYLIETEDGLIMGDYSGGHIPRDEAISLISALNAKLKDKEISFFPGMGYRNIMLWKNGKWMMETTPPHDIQGKRIDNFVPRGEGASFLIEIMEKARNVLKDHETNKRRIMRGDHPANSIWLWGQGKKGDFVPFKERFRMDGATVCAVDLIKGISRLAGLFTPYVEGATGYLDTDYSAKAKKAIELLSEFDVVYVHVEAPDEASHEGKIEEKIKAIENIDSKILGPIYEEKGDEVRFLIVTDHYTPIPLRTHYANPTPFVIFDERAEKSKSDQRYDETIGDPLLDARDLLSLFFGKDLP
ncbi:MAG: cofactor-independent phosphoglycerate mutase [Desulfobacterota bacterium]|nr:cofactor-independent phosphoglycerate mutase [Thermodesulfobacteriota bacterium]MDW8001933.1 cofactor-independent phosphoglycerate mutase [Deltaproteobacteria bacterium]